MGSESLGGMPQYPNPARKHQFCYNVATNATLNILPKHLSPVYKRQAHTVEIAVQDRSTRSEDGEPTYTLTPNASYLVQPRQTSASQQTSASK